MCLTIPGKILEIEGTDPSYRKARVDFAGSIRSVNLIYLPEATVGDYILVHAGFATEVVPEAEALEALRYRSEMDAAGTAAAPAEVSR